MEEEKQQQIKQATIRQVLGDEKDYQSGEGTYIENGKLYSGINGVIKIQTNEQNQKRSICVYPKGVSKAFSHQIGSVVYAQVISIQENNARVKIKVINGRPCYENLEGQIKKEHIRNYEIGKLKMQECFLPGDIIKAKILSMGDSRKMYLTTAGNDLGVVFARSSQTKSLMMPLSWSEMISPDNLQKEKRKVAKPDLSIFQ